MRRALASLVLFGSLFILTSPARAAQPTVFDESATPINCVVQQAGPVAGQRWCGSSGTQNSAPTTVASFDNTPIDVSVVLPPEPQSGPDGNFPVIGAFHGYGQLKLDHSNATIVQRYVQAGYAVMMPQARGFWGSCGVKVPAPKPAACAKGFVHLNNVGVEVRDVQHLLGLLADEGVINPNQIGATGQSYGGGLSLLLATLKNRVANEPALGQSPTYSPWTSPDGTAMSIAAAAPQFGWSDLMHSLVPNGSFYDYAAENPYRGPAGDRRIGVQKQGWTERLYNGGLQSGVYTTADERYDLPDVYTALNTGGPYDGNTELETAVDQLTRSHSAYYLDDSVTPAPSLLSQGWNDDLFPVSEAVRYYNKVRENHPDAPIQLWAFDFGHTPRSSINTDNATALFLSELAWMNHYIRGTGPEPADAAGGVRAFRSACTDETSTATAATSPIVEADSWAALSNGEVRITGNDPKTIAAATQVEEGFQNFGPNPPATTVCTTSGIAQTPGSAMYTLPAQADPYTIAGAPTVIADLTIGGANDQLVARLYDVNTANQTQRLISRGVYRPRRNTAGTEEAVFQLWPQMWRVQPGHELKLELLTTDSPPQPSASNRPFVRTATGQNPLEVDDVELRVPTRDAPKAGSPVQTEAPKVLPPGYELARDFAAEVTPTPTPTVTPTATYVIPTPTPTATPPYSVKKRPGLTAKARPKRDRKKPFIFRVQGRLVLPSGVSRAAGCKGTVRIIGKKGNTVVAKRRTGIKSTCKYKARAKLRKNAGRRGKVKFQVRFLGNDRLLTAKARTSARYGRK
jgi:predicted acyl esterase